MFVVKDNAGTATQGHVLTVDANGEAGFAAASGGGLSSDAAYNTFGGSDTGSNISGGDSNTGYRLQSFLYSCNWK